MLDGLADKNAITSVTRTKGILLCSNIGTIRDYALQRVLLVSHPRSKKELTLIDSEANIKWFDSIDTNLAKLTLPNLTPI